MDLQEDVSAAIARIVRSDPGDRLPGTETPYFDDPLVGFVAATDPLSDRYKEIIGLFHWTPAEVFEAEYAAAAPAPRTVVSWVLPITEATRKSNGREQRFPSRSWAFTEISHRLARKIRLVCHSPNHLDRHGSAPGKA
jgi:hypothetical protein